MVADDVTVFFRVDVIDQNDGEEKDLVEQFILSPIRRSGAKMCPRTNSLQFGGVGLSVCRSIHFEKSIPSFS